MEFVERHGRIGLPAASVVAAPVHKLKEMFAYLKTI
jgi:hypothetical protein